MEFGSSFSHLHLKWLGLKPSEALREYKKLGFTWIRLGCYWSEIEKKPGIFSFSELDALVHYCENEKIKIVMSVGMKAPRWPEYYLPDWLSQKLNLPKFTKIDSRHRLIFSNTLHFIDKCVRHYKPSKAIKVWQVENEPLDQSGINEWIITPNFLKREVSLVRKIDPKRKIKINVWGNEMSNRKSYQKAIELADIVGLDIYLQQPVSFFFHLFNRYTGPLDSTTTLHKIIKEIQSRGKEFWLTELQAEPWETDGSKAITINPLKFTTEHVAKNLKYGKLLHPSVILFWGFEHWYYRKMHGDTSFWKIVASRDQIE